ncbi:hypothetical protein CAPTEDRAFT_110406 [Capitella teleta]|uniref:Protein Wnt n=1 Tax=Capitella teleta TaxID=283909 RepID=Q2QJF8_CAPTE|nr:wingless/Wnt1 protein [Capitella teleta]ELT95358.1 hypothetical protein CAPTEDRAFT_110406 [Capitella teleta]|eukprot:ELT95358.1 hypothetical protein CAPTEDRAFT_110406 [Capitella teleta]
MNLYMFQMLVIFVGMATLEVVTPGKGGGKRSRTRGVKWWNLAHTQHFMSDSLLNPETPLFINPSLQPLTRKQRRLVTRNPGTSIAIAKAARMAVDECQRQFSTRRWNCPVYDASHGSSIFGKVVRKGIRECAFIYAIMSAALAHSIARSCAEGSIYTCTCGRHSRRLANSVQPRDWEWGGCSDNAEFGRKFSHDFIDVAEKGRDLKCLMNLHNSEAGRTQVSSEMSKECKCHGMSGSCTVKTCWMKLPMFGRVGKVVKDRFDGASQVEQGNGAINRSKNRFNLIPINTNHKPPEPKDLVYFERSPTFCTKDPSIGHTGTHGRPCNASSIGVEGCDLLCCGRGYRSELYTARERCNCIFHWCCKVTCDTCTKTKVRHICL